MLTTLTTYLLQHKQVAIPGIGSFELKHQPATLDFASRLILPPSKTVVFDQHDSVNDQQIAFMSEAMNMGSSEVSQQLQALGQQLKQAISQKAFEWNGIGRLEEGATGIVFQSLLQNKLTSVEAHKVMRENVSHTVTVGDKEMQSNEAAELLHEETRSSYLMIIVWILIALALLFIGYLFYVKGFSPLSSGSQQKFGYIGSSLSDVC
ncbi:hypothetical protein [Flavisolibacter tropicus]|uniref:CCDC81-like prokaryotic HU domain-containing protein n=1 Tax=Flavisolibacter tropicus TaxID=1492898 RepID=A0A172TS95_9BACT|nr:hypothetical protein [Flavisolibacter tropicus]ANE49900.1 hypothetical protein SY85_04740 [Flavisolibacter tropicus]